MQGAKRRIRDRSRTSATLRRAARLLDISREELYSAFRRGLVHATRAKDGSLRISYAELWEYGRILGLEMWHTPVPSFCAFIGTPLWQLGQEEGIASATAVTRCLHLYSGYDGAMYLSPQAIRLSTLPELEFVCRNIFRYNQIVRRHRPFAKLRHVVLGCDSATRAKAENIQRVINNRYPECVVLVPFQHLYRVKRRETSNG